MIGEINRRFGNQVLVLSVDARRADWAPSGFEVTTHGGRTAAGLMRSNGPAAELIRRGEILLNSMDADGTTGGFDLEMIRAVRAVVDVPLIASGGAGRVADFPPTQSARAPTRCWPRPFFTSAPADRRGQVGDRGRRISGTPCRLAPTAGH